MRRLVDTVLGLTVCVCILASPSQGQNNLPRVRRQSSIYFREAGAQGKGVRFQEQEEPRWSSPSDRLHSRASVVHDPGPSWSSSAQHPWEWSSLGQEGRSGHSFKFRNEQDTFRSLTSPVTTRSAVRFDNSEDIPSTSLHLEGRSNSKQDSSDEFHIGFHSNESNEGLFGKSNIDFSDNTSNSDDDSSLWRSKEDSSLFPSDPPRPKKHFGRQSKVSPMFLPEPPLSMRDSFEFPEDDSVESSRHLSPDTIATISETLGAINTVGRYLVNYTRGGRPRPSPDRFDEPPRTSEDLPGALLTISKNVLGRNVTDSLAPLVRVLPLDSTSNSGSRSCTTPGGRAGHCDDLSNCPQLLLDLANLRQSICFKSLFVPGVCCPRSQSVGLSEEVVTTHRPIIITTSIPLQTAPTQASYTTSTAPPLSSQPINSLDYDFNAGDCGQQDVPKFRVVGGEEALPGRWPWMAAIFLHGPRRSEFWCGGSLIGSRHVLTAAHCTKDTRQRPFQARQFTVRLGDIDLRREDEPSAPQTYRVSEVRAHPRFSRVGFYNDIAVLVLDRPVRRSRYVIPVCLPPPTFRSSRFVGEQPTVIGWGTTYYGGKESTVQRQVALPVWKNEDCDKTYFQPINENFICAGLKEGGKDACQGDSGGPLILKKNGRWMQIGIVSFGNKCGEPGYPGVYTRVTQYLDWITSNMAT